MVSTTVYAYLAAAFPILLAIGQAIKKKVPFIPNDYTGAVTAVLAFVFGMLVVLGLVPAVFGLPAVNYHSMNTSQWTATVALLLFYSFSHAGVFEVIFKGDSGSVVGFIQSIFAKEGLPPPPAVDTAPKNTVQ